MSKLTLKTGKIPPLQRIDNVIVEIDARYMEQNQPMKPPKPNDNLSRIHPDIRDKYIPLPDVKQKLTREQLRQIFSGDLNALTDIIRLIKK